MIASFAYCVSAAKSDACSAYWSATRATACIPSGPSSRRSRRSNASPVSPSHPATISAPARRCASEASTSVPTCRNCPASSHARDSLPCGHRSAAATSASISVAHDGSA